MAASDGFRRMRRVGISLFVVGIMGDCSLIVDYMGSRFFGRLMPASGLGFLGIPFTLIGGALLLSAWIAEGFALPHPPPGS